MRIEEFIIKEECHGIGLELSFSKQSECWTASLKPSKMDPQIDEADLDEYYEVAKTPEMALHQLARAMSGKELVNGEDTIRIPQDLQADHREAVEVIETTEIIEEEVSPR